MSDIKKYKIGYTQGTFDMFHIGHLNLINNAKKYCDYLIVGVNSDSLVMEYKQKATVICQQHRELIVHNLKAVDDTFIANTLDKEEILRSVKYDAIFIGDDWADNKRWLDTKEKLGKLGVDVVFLPHTDNISSTILRDKEKNAIEE